MSHRAALPLDNNISFCFKQKQCFSNLSRVADGVPVVGHVKGVIHYAVGDTEGGHQAMRSSTRTCGMLVYYRELVSHLVFPLSFQLF